MNRQEYLKLVCKEIHFIFDRKAVQKELEQHLEDSMLDLMLEERLSKEDAETKAVMQMGDPVEVGKQLNEEHHPVLGYLWMLSRALVVALLIIVIPSMIAGVMANKPLREPVVAEGSKEVYPVDVVVKMPSYEVHLDNICLLETGAYRLTYRYRTDFVLQRVGNAFQQLITATDKNGNSNFGSTHLTNQGIMGFCGELYIEWPEDGRLYIDFPNGEQVVLKQEVYCNEKK